MTKEIKYVDGNFGNDPEQKIGLVECFCKIAQARQSRGKGGYWKHLLDAPIAHVDFVPRDELTQDEQDKLAWDDNAPMQF